MHEKTFFSKEQKTKEEVIDYIKCMTLNQKIDDLVYLALTNENYMQIKDYMQSPMTARKKYKKQNSGHKYITSEDIYYNMLMNGIPLECQKWHINRLLALIDYFNVHNSDGKKMSRKDTYQMYSELNASRRRALNSKG